jgi:hypothetical protein
MVRGNVRDVKVVEVRKMARPETRVENNFVRWCGDTGLFCLKLAGVNASGFPDRTVILPGGRLVCVEFKSERGRTTPVQDLRIATLRKLGVPVLVTSDAEEAKEFVRTCINAIRG